MSDIVRLVKIMVADESVKKMRMEYAKNYDALSKAPYLLTVLEGFLLATKDRESTAPIEFPYSLMMVKGAAMDMALGYGDQPEDRQEAYRAWKNFYKATPAAIKRAEENARSQTETGGGKGKVTVQCDLAVPPVWTWSLKMTVDSFISSLMRRLRKASLQFEVTQYNTLNHPLRITVEGKTTLSSSWWFVAAVSQAIVEAVNEDCPGGLDVVIVPSWEKE